MDGQKPFDVWISDDDNRVNVILNGSLVMADIVNWTRRLLEDTKVLEKGYILVCDISDHITLDTAGLAIIKDTLEILISRGLTKILFFIDSVCKSYNQLSEIAKKVLKDVEFKIKINP